MMEKPSLLPWSDRPQKEPRSPRNGWRYLALAIVAGLFVLKLPFPTLQHSRGCHGSHDMRYEGEHIVWHGCGDLDGRDLECSEIHVPMDQFSRVQTGNKTFLIPLIRLRGRNATENLLLNPGGPGGSGFEFMHRRGKQLNHIVGEGFHLLTFDPRGVNTSRPMASCYPDQDTRRDHSNPRDGRAIADSPDIYAWSGNFVRACKDTMGEHGAYINTPQTAADMNSILDAVGQERMVYWGFSYGTILGQTYATLFPERSERVIIDGVANNFDWYQGLLDAEAVSDTEKVMQGFFDECIKAGRNCSLSAHGSTKEELQDKILAVIDALREQPLSVYVNNTVYGILDGNNILYDGIFTALYKPPTWYSLADRLARLLDGNATEAFLAWATSPRWNLEGDANTFVTNNDGLTGPKHYPHDRQGLVDLLLPFLNSSLFAPTENDGYYQRQKWALKKTHDFVPRNGVQTAHPLLILSTTYDPICPLVSARSANAAFEGSRIVEVLGYGHCTVAVPSTCLAQHVRAFLYNGTVPAEYTKCEVDGPYFVKPEEDGKAVALKDFDDDTTRRIHLAQVELARDPDWPRW